MARKKFRLYSPVRYNMMEYNNVKYDLVSFLTLELKKKNRMSLYPLLRYRIRTTKELWFGGIFNSCNDVYRIAEVLSNRYHKIITPKELSNCHTVDILAKCIIEKKDVD